MAAVTAIRALRAGGRFFRLPEKARVLDGPPAARRLPCAPPGLLGLAMVDRRGATVWALSLAPVAWVVVEHAGGAVVCGGDAVVEAPAQAEPLVLPTLAPAPPPEPISLAVPAAGGLLSARTPRSRGTYVLMHGSGSVTVPLAALEGIGTLPLRGATPDGALPAGAIGRLEIGGRPALLLDPVWCTGFPAAGLEPAGPVALLHIEGRLLAMPIGRAAPGEEGASLEDRLRDTEEGRTLLAAAPEALPPGGLRSDEGIARLLVCEAGGERFAVAVAEIATVIAPMRPAPAPAPTPALRGIVSHRGDVLPVHDLAARLARPLSAAALAAAPLLRLALPRPVAVPVERVLGLRSLPTTHIEPVAGDPLVAGHAPLDGLSLRVCRAAALPA